MKKFMQVLLASFGVMTLVLAGCQAGEEVTPVEGAEEAPAMEEAAPAVDATGSVESAVTVEGDAATVEMGAVDAEEAGQ
jgi:hypothetical protein